MSTPDETNNNNRSNNSCLFRTFLILILYLIRVFFICHSLFNQSLLYFPFFIYSESTLFFIICLFRAFFFLQSWFFQGLLIFKFSFIQSLLYSSFFIHKVPLQQCTWSQKRIWGACTYKYRTQTNTQTQTNKHILYLKKAKKRQTTT